MELFDLTRDEWLQLAAGLGTLFILSIPLHRFLSKRIQEWIQTGNFKITEEK